MEQLLFPVFKTFPHNIRQFCKKHGMTFHISHFKKRHDLANGTQTVSRITIRDFYFDQRGCRIFTQSDTFRSKFQSRFIIVIFIINMTEIIQAVEERLYIHHRLFTMPCDIRMTPGKKIIAFQDFGQLVSNRSGSYCMVGTIIHFRPWTFVILFPDLRKQFVENSFDLETGYAHHKNSFSEPSFRIRQKTELFIPGGFHFD